MKQLLILLLNIGIKWQINYPNSVHVIKLNLAETVIEVSRTFDVNF